MAKRFEASDTAPLAIGKRIIRDGGLPLLEVGPQELVNQRYEMRGGYFGAPMEEHTNVNETTTTIGNLVARYGGRVAVGPHLYFPDNTQAYGIWVAPEVEARS